MRSLNNYPLNRSKSNYTIMKLLFKIARTELRNLFYSPIAWFLTIAFFLQCAITYTKLLHNFAVSQETGGISLLYLTNLTSKLFTSQYGLFVTITQTLYLYIPLLTMGLISREINSGTISLLYSSPIKIREIVFGKYLAMLFYNLILVGVIGVFLVAGMLDIKSADWGMLVSAALGFYLLLGAYTAIGLFMSSLTSYQVVAAICTFVMIGILSYIGTLWQGVDFVRDLTYFLSLSGRTQHMLTGLITTKDVIYFITIIYIFLGLSISKLQFGRETKPWRVKAGVYAAIVVSALAVGYITSRPGLIGYWDTTADKNNTLTPNAQKIIKELGDAPLEVTVYTNYLDNYAFLGMPERRNMILALWEPYLRFKPNINFRYVIYYDRPMEQGYDIFASYKGKTMPQIVAQKAKAEGLNPAMFKTPEQIKKMADLTPESNRFVMQLTYKGKSTFLRIFNDMAIWPGESEVSAAFKRLLQDKMPVIGFVTGNGERKTNRKGDRAYKLTTSEKTFRQSLINQGFDVDTLALDKQEIPDNVKALVLADPQTALSPLASEKIEAYISRGGNVVMAGEPGRQQLINPLLKTIGVQLNDGMLEQKSEDNAPWLLLPHFTPHALTLSGTLKNPSIDTLPVSFNGATSLSFTETNGFKAFPLIQTLPGVAYNTSARNPDLSLVGTEEAAATDGLNATRTAGGEGFRPRMVNTVQTSASVSVHAQPVSAPVPFSDNTTKTYTTVLGLTRHINGKEQRIIVSGDADFMSNAELRRDLPRVANFYFNTALFSWLDNGEFPVNTSRPDSKDNRVTVSVDRVGLLNIWYLWVLPSILLIIGSVLLIRRKRK